MKSQSRHPAVLVWLSLLSAAAVHWARTGDPAPAAPFRLDRIAPTLFFTQVGSVLRQAVDGTLACPDIDMRPIEPDYGPLPFVFFLAGHFEHLTLRNIHSDLPVDSRSVIRVQPHAEIAVLSVEGMQIHQQDARSAQTPVIQVDGLIDLLEVRDVTRYRGKEVSIDGALIRTDPDKPKLKNYLRIGTRQTPPNPPLYGTLPVVSRGWPEALASLEIIPKINRVHLSNITVNRLQSVVQHDLGEIGHLQLDNIMTSDVPNPISVGGDAKIGTISPASAKTE